MEENKNPFDEKIEEQNDETVEVAENIENSDLSEKNESEEESKLNELSEKYNELNNRYLRLAADFDNFRKRTIQEKEELSKFTSCQILKEIAGVLDTFDRASEQLKDIEECKTVKEGYEIAYKQLIDTLKKIGMEEIECIGKDFNPNEHEAITQIPTDEFEADKVAVVAKKGYKLADKIIRPALVGVAIKKEAE